MRFGITFIVLYLFTLAALKPGRAQEAPYFVTYEHHMEEPGNLEVGTFSTVLIPRSGQRFYSAPYMELEYGVTGSWTSELYLESQSSWADSTIFTGWRLENRFRPLRREHWVNPVLYLEYENLNEGSRIKKEIVGNASGSDSSNRVLQQITDHELESKLILSSNIHDWNLAENFIVEKNLSRDEGFEFGYAFGLSRPLARLASSTNCRLCAENFSLGVEFYGGLGSTQGFALHDTAHYVAPVVSWQLSDNGTLHFSPAIGLTSSSNPVLIRFGYSYEIRGIGSKLAQLLTGRR